MALGFQQGWYRWLSFETLAAQRQALGAFVDSHFVASLAVYVGLYVVVVALSIPGATIMTLAGGLLYGWILGGAATVVAATAGSVVIFLIARSSLGAGLAKKAGGVAERMAEGFRQNALSYMLFLRLVPVFPFWLVNLAPALLGVPLATYVIGTFFGIIPGTLAFTFVGAGLDSVIDAQTAARAACLERAGATPADCPFSFELSSIVTPELLAALVLLGAVALIPVFLKKRVGAGRLANDGKDKA
ncbi:MAG: TVP38/TMEM64 family protein [Rhodobiaceae bacterium]|nr:TVP38/TMEM64 family protein [Rhodobiaceae bacterium]MCC0055098.1 TVP38/TMEM64 family protein [Rhodobiaceae bacterium]